MADLFAFMSDAWFGAALGLFGIAFAIYSYWRAKKIVQISYEVEEMPIVGTPHSAFSDQMKVLFRDVVVPRVTATRLRVWNAGTVPIRRSDIAERDPIVIDIGEDATVLQATLDKATRSVNAVALIDGAPSFPFKIDFDYLDSGDGFAATIIHTARMQRLTLKGTVIDQTREICRALDADERPFYMLFYLGMILPIFIPVLAWMAVRSSTLDQSITHSRATTAIYLVVILIICAFNLRLYRKHRPPRLGRRRPYGLE